MSKAIKILPFIKSKNNRINYWIVENSSCYETDCQLGSEYAKLTILYMKKERLPPLLSWIVQDMPRNHTGIEIGFLTEIAKNAT